MAAFTGAAAEHRLLAKEGGGEGCLLRPCTEGYGLHSLIVLHRAFLPCSLTCSVTNYSLIAGWQKKSFAALRLFLTNQVTEALKIILSRREAPCGFLGCLGCVKLDSGDVLMKLVKTQLYFNAVDAETRIISREVLVNLW